ncbi:alpha/beta-hydrolase family protein [Arthrobacter sp. TWP1-1]|uniref:alpha/beta-hydrolase family protein n=1 Tax=Arthrobacter sp. TWP1-1 TaxID=2804568 RepID=UPI003CEDC70E
MIRNHRTTTVIALIAGISAVALALTPSLVPRPALFQGFLAGLSFGLAYLAAAIASRFLARTLARRRARTAAANHAIEVESVLPGQSNIRTGRTQPFRFWIWLAAGAAGVAYTAVVGRLAIGWQNDVRQKVDMPRVDGLDLVTFFLVAVLMAAVVFAAHWGLRKLVDVGRGWTRRATPVPRLVTAGGFFTALLGAVIAVTLLVSAALVGTDVVYAARNQTTPNNISEPSSEFRSAGAQSLVSWDQLGMQGRTFVGGGPHAALISSVTQLPAIEPIRVYVGQAQGNTMEDRANLAVAELKRTGGFKRSTLMIATPTGSGWLERQAVDSLEYLHGGDTAIVSMQYSYQPSWVSFLFHQDLPRNSGQALYKAVRTEWLAMPAEDRPKLLVYGLSLGASGMQSAFSSAEDLVASVDGAVFSGAPNNSQPWGTLQARRDAGSPPWQPVYNAGRNIRWLSNSGDFGNSPGVWEPSRIAYLQHGTDAVSWLTPRLIWTKPDWLAGPAASGGRAPDVSDSMLWMPLITYLQVAFDMFMGESVPASHGHNFGDVAVEAWNGVAPSGLDADAVARIETVIATYAYEESMTN